MKEGITRESSWVCTECGNEYLKEQGYSPADGIHTYHENECCVCHQVKSVTHERHFRWLVRWKSDKWKDK